MRTFSLLIAILFIVGASGTAQAQITPAPRVNVGVQPIWGPTGFDHVDNYYLPDIETYYNVPQARFYSFEGGRWVGRSRLPARYHDFDLYNSYKAVVNDPRPYQHHATYRDQYASFKGRHDQKVIRDSQDERYFVNKNHPEHAKWMKSRKHDNGKHKGYVNGRGNGRKKN
jgi:hypothetical protein